MPCHQAKSEHGHAPANEEIEHGPRTLSENEHHQYVDLSRQNARTHHKDYNYKQDNDLLKQLTPVISVTFACAALTIAVFNQLLTVEGGNTAPKRKQMYSGNT